MKKVLLVAVILLMTTMLVFAGGGKEKSSTEEAGFGEGVPINGDWAAYNDIENKGDSKVTMTEVDVNGMKGHRFVGNTTTKYQYGFCGWNITPDAESLEAIKQARAISFKFKSDGKRYTIKYRISTVKDYADHEYHFFGEANQEETVEVPIQLFMQASWGTPVRLRKENAVDIAWQTHEAWRPGNFDITIWDVRAHP